VVWSPSFQNRVFADGRRAYRVAHKLVHAPRPEGTVA
jgi:hypothetical protein